MDHPEVEILTAAAARRALTNGDIRNEIAFQNDINALIARLEEKRSPLRALSDLQPDVTPWKSRFRRWRAAWRQAG
jgi:hypothetical protein